MTHEGGDPFIGGLTAVTAIGRWRQAGWLVPQYRSIYWLAGDGFVGDSLPTTGSLFGDR
ncbi:MAG: hypothetical protein ACKN81_05465 [Pirellulaceae bacterium]